MAYEFNRRYFFFGSLLAGAIPASGFGSAPSLRRLGYKSPNEKLNIASIGAGGKAFSDIKGCASENIVALCDVDEVRAARKFKEYPKVPKYKDFRRMLDEQANNIDAVIVAIPDFMHATAAMWCMERGKHVYVQKPLTRTVWEARQMLEAAKKYKVATQMGNQGYSNEGTRQAAEMIWAGEIGKVTEVHAWTDRPIWPQGLTEIPACRTRCRIRSIGTSGWASPRSVPIPRGGPDYQSPLMGHFYQPGNWRGFYDFGCGALGDMACHILGAPNLALQLGAPTSVECIQKEGPSDFMFPKKSVIRYDFPARGIDASGEDVLARRIEGNAEDPGRAGRRVAGRSARNTAAAPAGSARQAPPYTGYMGDVFNYAKFQATKTAPNARVPEPDGSLFIGDKGMHHDRHIRRGDPAGSHGEDEGLPVPAAHADALARPLPRLDPRLQRRRSGMLEFQRRRAVCRMDAAGGDRAAGARQAGVGRGEDAVHQQRGSKSVSEAHVPQRLVVHINILLSIS